MIPITRKQDSAKIVNRTIFRRSGVRGFAEDESGMSGSLQLPLFKEGRGSAASLRREEICQSPPLHRVERGSGGEVFTP
jgi:hypothetical protein